MFLVLLILYQLTLHKLNRLSPMINNYDKKNACSFKVAIVVVYVELQQFLPGINSQSSFTFVNV